METTLTKTIEITRTDDGNDVFHIYEVRVIDKGKKESRVYLRYLDEKAAEECADFICENMQTSYKTAFVIPVLVWAE